MKSKETKNNQILDSFWPMIFVAVAAVISVGIIMWSANMSKLQEDLTSLSVAKHSTQTQAKVLGEAVKR